MSKGTNAEVSQRVLEVQGLLLEGRTRHFILQYSAKWQLEERQVDNYIAQATALIKEINSLSAADNLALITMNQWTLFRNAVRDGEGEQARKILMDIAKVRGLGQDITHIIEDKRDLAELSDSALDELLLEERH